MNTPNLWRKDHQLPVLASRADLFYARLEVDVGNTAFNEGLEYRISSEYSVTAGSPLTYQFSSPVDFILQEQSLTVDTGNIRFRAYRSTQGTPTGDFTDLVPISKNNGTSTTKGLEPFAVIFTGGGFTPDMGQKAVETIRLRAANATASRSTVSGNIGDERGLPAGTYYLELSVIDGNTTAEGVFDLKWAEDRSESNDVPQLEANTLLEADTEMSIYG